MNSANFFLVVVTVFALLLECSAAPSAPSTDISNRVAALLKSFTANILGSGGDTVVIDEETLQFFYRSLEEAQNTFTAGRKNLANAISTAQDEQKGGLLEVEDFFDGFLEGAVFGLSDQLLDALDRGSVSKLTQTKSDISEAIIYVTGVRDHFRDNVLSDGKVKDDIIYTINNILDLSIGVVENLGEVLAGTNALV